jgi:predicted ATP-dependent endonuclease of OLD family
MYLTGLHIKNVRSIDILSWEIEPEQASGWHVMIGDNGSGKSSVLRSIAIALIGDAGVDPAILKNVSQ